MKKLKRRKKGFTLIELLAVIIILAIILIIAIPAIGNIIKNSRENTIASSLKLMESSARTYVNKTGEFVPKEGNIEIIPLDTLVKKNYISKIVYPDNNKNECDGAVIVTNINGRYTYEGYLNCGGYLSDNLSEIYEQLDKTAEQEAINVLKENTSLLPISNGSVTLDIESDLNLSIKDPMDPKNNVVTGNIIINHGTSIITEAPVGGDTINTGTMIEINSNTYQIISDIVVKNENDKNIYVNGEVINDNNDEEAEPEPEPEPDPEIEVTQSSYIYFCGYSSFYKTSNNSLYAFGANSDGQLGDGTTVGKTTPTLISIPGETIKKVNCGTHSTIITESGKLYTFGDNYYGQLGDGTKTDRNTPTLITIAGETIKDAAASDAGSHTMILTNSGKLYTVGYNINVQLGDGTAVSKSVPTLIPIADETLTKVDAYSAASAVLTESGHVYMFGRNSYGKFGNGLTNTSHNRPTLINFTDEKIIDISVGQNHTIFLTESGKAYATGYNAYGQLGDGTTVDKLTPILIQIPKNEKIRKVAAAHTHSVIITMSGKLYTFGRNNYGQLGDGTTEDKLTPTLITIPNEYIIDVSASNYSTAVITNSGKLYTFGRNSDGQLGDRTKIDRNTPTLITIP